GSRGVVGEGPGARAGAPPRPSTPSRAALALRRAVELLGTGAAGRRPLIVWLADGPPTVDLSGRGPYTDEASPYDADLMDGAGGWLPWSQVAWRGTLFGPGGAYAGQPAAEVMRELELARGTLPELSIHTLGLQGDGAGSPALGHDLLEWSAWLTSGAAVDGADPADLAQQADALWSTATCGGPPPVDSTPPTVTLVSPADGAVLDDQAPTVRIDWSDDLSGVDLDSVIFEVNGVDRTNRSVVEAEGLTWRSPSPLSGTQSLLLTLADLAGTGASLAGSFAVTVAGTPPNLTLLTPGAETFEAFEIRLAYSDLDPGLDLETLRVTVDGRVLTPDCQVGPAEAVCATSLEAGDHVLEASIQDLDGTGQSLRHLFAVRADIGPPNVQVTAPAEGALLNAPLVQVTGTATDDLDVAAVTVNGVAATLVDGSFTATVELVGSGERGLEVVATDLAGQATTVLRTVVLDQLHPEIMLLGPEDGTVTYGAEIEVRGWVEDGDGVSTLEVAGQPVVHGPETFSATVPLAEGPNAIAVQAWDFAGNTSIETLQVIRRSLPSLVLTSPANFALVSSSTITVEGKVDDPAATVTVAGIPATVTGGTFAVAVSLREGANPITASATDSLGRTVTATVTAVLDTTPPKIALASPLDGTVVRQPTVSVSGWVNEAAGGYDGIADLQVTVNGAPAGLVNGSFVVVDLALVPGDNVLTAAAQDPSGNVATDSITVRYDDSPGVLLSVVSGNHQTAVVGQALGQPLLVELTDLSGQPMVGETVHFAVLEGNGTLDSGDRQRAVTTDSGGRASVQYTLGTRSGMGNHRVMARAVGADASVEMSASATAAAPAHVLVDAGDQQQGIAGEPLPQPFAAVVTDASFNRLPGVDVVFRVFAGGGTFADGSQEITLTSDVHGAVSAVLTLGPEEGVANNSVLATVGTGPGAPTAAFAASGRTAGDPADTAIVGVVLDNTDRPVPGVTLEIVETGQSAIADAAGTFRIPNAPVGTVHLHVDGTTATVPGLWSSLEFLLTTIPGRDNDVGRPIFILPIDVDRGLAVSETEGGSLTLPELPGFALDVEPGSVTFPDGGREGVISVTLVHGDKIPMVPNFSQQPSFVITVQPPGAIFDPPARLTFPNVDGMAPGQVSELYSFDHDIGRFTSIGPGQVSEDGRSLVSMPGFGLVKAGWHCGGDPASSGTPEGCEFCERCDENICVPNLGLNFRPCPDDGDRCTTDYCAYGDCFHWMKRVDEVDAKANSQDSLSVYIGEPVLFTQRSEGEHCSVDGLLWDFGDGTQSNEAAPVKSYPDPGTYQFQLEASCDNSCAENTDSGAVQVTCPNVTFTKVEPDVDYLCPGCTMRFFYEVEPDFHLEWRVTPPGAGTLTFGQDQQTMERYAVFTPSAGGAGAVEIEAAAAGKFDFSECKDSRSIEVLDFPNLPGGPLGLNDEELGILTKIRNLDCSPSVGTMFVLGPIVKDQVFSCQRSDGQMGNAFMHAFMNCFVAAKCGKAFAKQIYDAHEDSNGNPTCEWGQMDLHNNAVGRAVSELGFPELCRALVKEALFDGRLRWMMPPMTCMMEYESNVPPNSPCVSP
ncbi:MAG: PKD domain-containing protein, partial [Acidobacteriota bacterium]